MINPITRFVDYMVREGGAPSRYAVYHLLIVGVGLIAILVVLVKILREQLR